MPANLDQEQQQLILTVVSIGSTILLGFVAYVTFLEIPRLSRIRHQNQQEEEKLLRLQEKKQTTTTTPPPQEQAPPPRTEPLPPPPLEEQHVSAAAEDDPHVLWSCIQTFAFMAVSTWLLTWPILRQRNNIPLLNNDEEEEEQDYHLDQTTSSSINFCEADFRHTPYMAEPTNTISSILAYLPLACIGAWTCCHNQYPQQQQQHRPTKQQQFRYLICYLTLFLIGVGSTLLHAFLTAVTQGGDELPMLWYTAATSYCAWNVILFSSSKEENNDNRTRRRPAEVVLGLLVAGSTLLSTFIYIQVRANFTYFYLLFSTYTILLSVSLIYMTLFLDWEGFHQHDNCTNSSYKYNGTEFKRRILLPLARACSLVILFATWCWVAEMVGCGWASQQPTGSFPWILWNYGLHPCWHFAAGIEAFLVVQVIHAADGFSKGYGMPCIIVPSSTLMAPLVVFHHDHPNEHDNGNERRKCKSC